LWYYLGMKGENKQTAKHVVTRFAPSPTGYFHIGGYRTAIFAYLYAKHNEGKFILRIEDTDKERNKKEYEDNILESLKWIGLEYDKFYRQSENIERHKNIIRELLQKGSAYISKEEAKDGSGAIKEIVRFKNPNKVVEIHDLIRGTVVINTTDLGDFVIARNIEDPLYHLAVVIDDWDEGVTHVIRGEEHISNTPRQILMLEALGAPIPVYAHLPLVLAPDRSKLSKRKGALPLTDYREMGYLPEALLNTMALIGWNPGTEQEIFALEELIKVFDLSKVQKGGAIFNPIKLDWINKEHIKLLPMTIIQEEIGKRISNFQFPHLRRGFGGQAISKDMLQKLTPIIFDRINKWSDVDEMIKAGELDYFFNTPEYDKEGLVWKKLKDNADRFALTKGYLEKVYELLHEIPESGFNHESVKFTLSNYAEEKGRGEVLWPLRFALSGLEKSPDPFTLAPILGKGETLSRIEKAIKKLSK